MHTKDEILSAINWGVQYALDVRGLEDVSVQVQHAESLDNVIQVVYVQHGDAEISPKRLLEQQQQEQVDDDYERAANATNPTGGGDYFT